jgi:hypothetical protein
MEKSQTFALGLCRFDWNEEAGRAQTLIASGEAEFDIDDEPLGLPSEESDNNLRCQ